MALDFHRLDNTEYLFGLDDSKYAHLETVFTVFKKQTGVYINMHADATLTINHQKMIVKIIDIHIKKGDLNKNKQKKQLLL